MLFQLTCGSITPSFVRAAFEQTLPQCSKHRHARPAPVEASAAAEPLAVQTHRTIGCVTALLWVIFASWPRLLQIWRATELQCTWGAAAVQGAAKRAVCRCGTLVQQGALRITWITVDTACWITVLPRSETDTQHSCRISGGELSCMWTDSRKARVFCTSNYRSQKHK
jgi:hypothetical protein